MDILNQPAKSASLPDAEFKEKDWSDIYNDEIAGYIKKAVS
jgi:hypothetical protein